MPIVSCHSMVLESPFTDIIDTDTVDSKKSLHFLLATIGRPSLQRMLDSLLPQLTRHDYLTIVFDGPQSYLQSLVIKTHATVEIIIEPKNLGYWGHGIRNKHNVLLGDFILHCDDDDIYTPGSVDIIRKICQKPDTLYIFKIQLSDKSIIPVDHVIRMANISTQSGVIPGQLNSKSHWGEYYGGDFEFYWKVGNVVDHVVWVDWVIYQMRPQ